MRQRTIRRLALITMFTIAACGGGPPPPAATEAPTPRRPVTQSATEIAGLGDGAFLSPRTDIATVIALNKGVATIDARAGDPDHARRLAELVFSKLE